MKHRATKKHQPKPIKKEEEIDLSFTAKDFPHHPKNHFWFIGISLLALALLTVLYRSGEYLLMAVVVALVLAMFNLAHLRPQHRHVKLNSRGIYWGDDFFPYFKLKSFWVSEANGVAAVYIDRLNFSPTLHFIVPETKVEELVVFLSENLPWHSHKNEPLSDKFSRLLRL